VNEEDLSESREKEATKPATVACAHLVDETRDFIRAKMTGEVAA